MRSSGEEGGADGISRTSLDRMSPAKDSENQLWP